MLFQTSDLNRQEYSTERLYRSTIRDETGYRPSLWVVNDNYFSDPEEKFRQTANELYEATVEGYGQGVFETVSDTSLIGLEKFCRDFLKFLNIPEIPEFAVKDQIRTFLNYLDYFDLYFPFYDTPVQLVSDGRTVTYTEKVSGATLDPEHVEVFRVQHGWDFWPYKRFNDLICSPQIQEFARGTPPINSGTGMSVTRKEVLEVLAEPVLGSYDYLEPHIADAMSWLFEEGTLRAPSVEVAQDYKDVWDFALESCMAVATATAAYLKSPMGLRLLIYYHPVYYELLDWNYDTDQPFLRPDTGGECIISGINVYTHKTLVRQENTPAGTCRSCNQTLHCTKRLDANALIWKVCSCGGLFDPADADRQSSHTHPECRKAWKEHPAIPSFVCLRCTEKHLKYSNPADAPPQLKCSRTACPNTACAHHMGEAYRRHELNQRRRLLLTQSSVH